MYLLNNNSGRYWCWNLPRLLLLWLVSEACQMFISSWVVFKWLHLPGVILEILLSGFQNNYNGIILEILSGFQNNYNHQRKSRDLWKVKLISVVDLWSRESGDTVPQKLAIGLLHVVLNNKMMPNMKFASHIAT